MVYRPRFLKLEGVGLSRQFCWMKRWLGMFTVVDGGNNVLEKLVSHKEEKLARRRAHLPLYSWMGMSDRHS